MSERQTIDLSTDPMALNKVMEFDHVIRVHLDGTVSHPSGVYAPEVTLYTDDDGQILDKHREELYSELRRQGWSIMRQYADPIMEPNYQLAGSLAETILETAENETPVDYVAVVVETDSKNCPNETEGCVLSEQCEACVNETGAQRERDLVGWMVLYQEVDGLPSDAAPADLNRAAAFKTYDGEEGWTPALVNGGIAVHAYVDDRGVFSVSVHTDHAPHPSLVGPDGAIRMEINVNDTEVFRHPKRQPPPNRWVAGSRVKFVGRSPLGRDGGVINAVHMDTRQVDITWDNGVQQYKSFGDLGAIWVFDNEASS